MVFEYREIEIRERRFKKEYLFEKDVFYPFSNLLNHIGNDGWEFVGEVEGKMFVKRRIESQKNLSNDEKSFVLKSLLRQLQLGYVHENDLNLYQSTYEKLEKN